MKTVLLFLLLIIQTSFSQIQNTAIDSLYPHQNSTYFPIDGTIKIFFSQPMDASTITSNSVFVSGNLTGKHNADVLYQSSNNSIEIRPTTTLKYGELISVTLDSLMQTDAGENITPYVFQFNVKPEIGSVKFAVADSFQLNFSPTNIISGDFNNDGNVDVIVSNYDSSKYTIALNNGSGGFSIGEVMAGVFKPSMIAFTDIDNDRDLDMIIPTNEENKIQIYTNTGQGVFYYTPPINANAPISICPGDFDGDGDNDFVALLNYGLFDGRAYVYKNNGNGNFTESGFTYIGFPQAIRNVAGDIDNDGDLDLVVGQSDYSGIFRTLLNDGNGAFTYYSGTNLGAYPDEFAGGDFDGDSDLDIIHGNWYYNGLGIMLNNGTGSYTSYVNLGNVGGQSKNPVANDFDGDGDLDFVVVFNNNNVGIVRNNGNPNYELYLSYPIAGLKGITSADFDNNGSMDLAVISSTTNQIKFLKNCVDSLVAYYPFAGDTKDFSGNINNGINYNGQFVKDRYANDASAIYFDGVNSYIEGINPGNNLPIGNASRTFTAWINNIENQGGSNIFHYGAVTSGPNSFHFLTSDVVAIGNGSGYDVFYGEENVVDSTWHFISGSLNYQNAEVKVYIDGKLDDTGVLGTLPITLLSNNWRIGRFMDGTTNFKGAIDEVKVFNVILSDQEIYHLYKESTTAPNLLFPGNDSTLTNPWPDFILEWDSTVTANEYRLLIANDSLFNTVVHDTLLNTSSFKFYDWSTVNIDNLYWKVRTINDGGIGPWSEVNHFNIILTDVEDEQQLPTEFALKQNYPNPFNPFTIIRYQLPACCNVSLKIYDVLGNEIATLVNEEKLAGSYEVEFNTSSINHIPSSGVYFYQLKAGDYLETKKMLMLK